MSVQSKNNFLEGVNLDLSPLRMVPNAASFIKNLTDNSNINQSGAGQTGFSQYAKTPMEGNLVLAITGLPSGTNYCCGGYSSEQTNELYFCVWNSSNNHTVWVISGDTGTVTLVHQNTLLPFSNDPKYFLAVGRITLELKSEVDPVTNALTNFKLLILTNNNGPQIVIDVAASIATNSYTTSYFTATAAFYNPLELIHLGATTPLNAIGLNNPTAYVPTVADASMQNYLIDSGWQFRVRTWDIWGRPSEWGIISSVYTVFIGGGCIATSNGLPRCLNLCFDAGNPLIKFITVAYRHNVGNDPSGSIETGWLEYDTFNKYNDSAGVEWYNRAYNPVFTTAGSGITFNASTNVITYTFCADKGSNPLDPTETSRTEPGLALMSGSAGSIEKRLALANNVYDFQPISQAVIDEVEFSAVLPTTVPCDAAPLRTIVVYSAIYQPVAVLADQHRGFILKTGSTAVFSGPGTSGGGCGSYGANSLDQVFGDPINCGFIAVMRGTSFKTICVQGDFDPTTGTFVPLGFGSGLTYPHGCVQQYTFTGVPAGKYIIQIASHKSTINDSNLGQTSTYVAGISEISDLVSSTGLNSYASNPIKEIEVDCTSGDVILNQSTDPLFTILSLEIEDGSAAIDGYLMEQNGSSTPMEMVPMYFQGDILGTPGGDVFGSFFTDHNGFYFAATDGDSITAYVFADTCNGSGTQNQPFISPLNISLPYITSFGGGIVHGDGSGTGSGCLGVHGNWLNQVYLVPTLGTFPAISRRTIKQTVNLCTNPLLGVPGIPVVMSKISASQLTDANGNVVFIAHNRYNYLTSIGSFPAPWLSSSIPDYSSSPYNEDVLVFSQKGGCEWNTCTGCSTSTADVTIIYLACGASSSGCPTTGPIGAAVINALGSGYTISDRVTINGSSTAATIQITAVNGSGGVTAFIFSSYGNTYTTGVAATTAVTGIGVGLTLNIYVPAPRTLCLTPVSLRINGVGIFGVQSGGKYPVAFVLHDVIGRHTSPQIQLGENGYVNVPNLNDTTPSPYPAMALCSLQVTIPAGLVVPANFTKMTIWVGKNVAFSDFFTWAADWVQFIDNTGNTNTANPTAIRFYIRSINEYNKQYNFETNIAWDFLTKSANENRSNDIVQFICNGDGTYLPSVQGAAITYDKEGIFFTIEYQAAFADLQNGCLLKIIRPKQDNVGTTLPYYEQSLTLKVVNGVLPAGTYIIPYQDSYLLSRFIPVPIMAGLIQVITPEHISQSQKNLGAAIALGGTLGLGAAIEYDTPVTTTDATATSQVGSQGVGISPGATPPFALVYSNTNTANGPVTVYSNINADTNGIIVVTPQNYPTTFPFFFESPSPSDLWGSHLASLGRVDIPNPYEQQYRVGTEIALSNPIADKGIVNGIGTFLEQNRQIFDRNTFGDITVILVEMGVVMVICNNDFFTTRYGQTQLQILESGQVVGQNPNGSLFTAPQIKIGSNYGVIPENINSIDHYNGIVVFLDNKGHLIISNFSEAKPAEKDGYTGYLLNKIAFTNNNNNLGNGKTFFHGRIDPKTMEYVLTNFNVPNSGSPSYINTESKPVLNVNETYIFDISTGRLKTFASFTPEYYGRIPGFFSQRQFLSFKNGVPYIHHNNFNIGTTPLYINFYGVQCEARITHIVNGVDAKQLPDKVKRFFYTEVYCRQSIPGAAGTMPTAMFYADIISTESGQQSRLLLAQWGLKNNVYCAAYLCDLNTPPDPNIPVATGVHAILDGNPLIGRWLQCSIVTNPSYSGTYFEISEKIDYIDGVEKSGD